MKLSRWLHLFGHDTLEIRKQENEDEVLLDVVFPERLEKHHEKCKDSRKHKKGTMVIVTIYSKKECHLCDIAKKALESVRNEFDFQIKEVDIEKDSLAFERFKNLIPVVEVDGTIISTGRVNVSKLKEILEEK